MNNNIENNSMRIDQDVYYALMNIKEIAADCIVHEADESDLLAAVINYEELKKISYEKDLEKSSRAETIKTFESKVTYLPQGYQSTGYQDEKPIDPQYGKYVDCDCGCEDVPKEHGYELKDIEEWVEVMPPSLRKDI
jgi:hypothetical protein